MKQFYRSLGDSLHIPRSENLQGLGLKMRDHRKCEAKCRTPIGVLGMWHLWNVTSMPPTLAEIVTRDEISQSLCHKQRLAKFSLSYGRSHRSGSTSTQRSRNFYDLTTFMQHYPGREHFWSWREFILIVLFCRRAGPIMPVENLRSWDGTCLHVGTPLSNLGMKIEGHGAH